ncbi:selenocysteine-specific translation elongation factor [Bacillus sp. CH30_1T]|uniref:selenocysteine-specific translation elongation factor n=1 Tax=Bacillus sp. CH30_1T TaxID=2604836 RepID=UPI0011EFC138|nr:selenocysteine-specific translation elongation factor [Bacillus sp. CH30_1T]KAA0564330.1 selenocysteine-specific translation elongation factor [Bacillus sp. CH30_1T]
MGKQYYTIGMAGHIDHGKTTLTKALTSVDTDRLKEEKERNISIEPGFAPLYQDEDMEISVVDVPGHERFIRQMIAGVAGIDLVVLVVAADEGVMPQTKEHLDILALLGITKGIVVLTKISKVEEELRDMALEEVIDELKGTVFEGAHVLMADSISGEGVQELKQKVVNVLKSMTSRSIRGDFRLPIDQVFTVKGQGAVVRGTVFEGTLETGEGITILPQGIHTKAKQIQAHHMKESSAYAGQRAAINLSGVDYKELRRGNVLVTSTHFTVTNTIDVCLEVLHTVNHPIKQRMPVVVHVGTSEVMGRLVFFDRNKVISETDPILCQIRLNESIVAKRGDRFILRRPSPIETIGGGWIIQPNGGKYKFGKETMAFLQSERHGTPQERVLRLVEQYKCVDEDFIVREASITHKDLHDMLQVDDEWIVFSQSKVTHMKIVDECVKSIDQILRGFHEEFPLLQGINIGELKQSLKRYTGALVDYAIEQKHWKRNSGFLCLEEFIPHLPPEWEKRCNQLITLLEADGTQVKDKEEYFHQVGIPLKWQTDFYHFFIQEKKIVPLDDKKSYSYQVFMKAVEELKEKTGDLFDIADAKAALGLSRKYLIPFLEKLDKDGLTLRTQGIRKWIGNSIKG